jgi:hypothetical protein
VRRQTRAVHIGATEFYGRNGKLVGIFVPNGALRPNKKLWKSDDPLQAARIIVGFNVGQSPTWSMGRVMELVKQIRREQGQDVDASFVFQRGFYTHPEAGGMVEEDGAQIIILNTFETPPKKFEQQMRQLADKIAYAMKQKEVIVEFQKAGRTYETYGMGPGK